MAGVALTLTATLGLFATPALAGRAPSPAAPSVAEAVIGAPDAADARRCRTSAAVGKGETSPTTDKGTPTGRCEKRQMTTADGPVQVYCEAFDPSYVIFGDSNGNRRYDYGEPVYVNWPFHVEWCYSADSNYPSAPVFVGAAVANSPMIAPGSRFSQSGDAPRQESRTWSSDGFLETATYTWGGKTFSTYVLTPWGELWVNYHPVIQIQVDGFGNENGCDLSAGPCPPIWG